MNRFTVFLNSRVARRIFFLFVVCALLPVCVLSLLSIRNVSSRLEQDGQERLRQVSKNAGMSILENLALLQNELENLSLSGKGKLESAGRMQLGAEGGKRFNRIYAIGRTGAIPFHGPVSSLPAEMSAHLNSGKALVLISYRQAEAVLQMVTKSVAGSSDTEYISGEINPEYLWGVVRMALPYGVELAVVDSSGRRLFSTFPGYPELVCPLLVSLDEARLHDRFAACGRSSVQTGAVETRPLFCNIFPDGCGHDASGGGVCQQFPYP
jgi:hypothetical protein